MRRAEPLLQNQLSLPWLSYGGPQTMGALSLVAAQERILFGSDWPFANERVVAEEVADFTARDFLTPQQREAISFKNALALFPQRAAQF